MIYSISIEHFRCFRQTRIEGFKQINLIGGQNNAGKTALLEALLIGNDPRPDAVLFCHQTMRRVVFSGANPELFWESLFYNQDKNSLIRIALTSQDQTWGSEHRCEEHFLQQSRVQPVSGEVQDPAEPYSVSAYSSSREISSSTLISRMLHDSKSQWQASIQAPKMISGQAQPPLITNELPHPALEMMLIPASRPMAPEQYADQYDRMVYRENSSRVLDALKLIDPAICDLRVFNFGRKHLYLKREGAHFMPVGVFGDAVNRVAGLIIQIASKETDVLLIDEIENGIHFTHHRDFWRMLFTAARQFEVQLFCTSHSLEMIRAFNEVSMQEGFAEETQYVELFRSARSGEIVGNLIPHETLAYAIATGQSFRGEE